VEEGNPWYRGLRSPLATRLWTGRPGIGAEFPTVSRVTLPQNVQVCSGPHIFSSTVSAVRVGKAALVCVAEGLFIISSVTGSVRYASIYDCDVHFTQGEG
jgi:hypothetical protein